MYQLRVFQTYITRKQISRHSKNMGLMLRLWLTASITSPSYNKRNTTDWALQHPDSRTLTPASYLRMTKAFNPPIWWRGPESWMGTPEMRYVWPQGQARAILTMVATAQHLKPLEISTLIEVLLRTLFYLFKATSWTPTRVSLKTTVTRKDVNNWSRILIFNKSSKRH